MTDEEIVNEILAGKKSLYEQIVRRYNQRLFRVARAIVKQDADAEDVLQEAYVRAYLKLDSFERKSAFSTWLTRIVINESLAKLKKNKKTMSEEYHPELPEREDLSGNPEKQLVNRELARMLERAVDTLPDKYRLVYIMREVEGMSIAETMSCLQLTEPNVKARLNRAKAMLREQLIGAHRKEIFAFQNERCERITAAVMRKI